MTLNAADLIDQLLRAPIDQRVHVLQSSGPVAAALAALIDQTSSLTGKDAARAVAASEIAVDLADRVGQPADQARARRARARALSYVGRFDEALRVADEAVQVAEAANQWIEAGRARLASMHALGELGRLDEAVQVGERARAIFIGAGDLALAARADINLGTAHQRRDDPATAVACFDRAKPQLLHEPLMLGHLENNRGEALLALNDFAGAESAFRAALTAFQNANAGLTAAIAEGNLADLAARQGRLHTALFHFERARRNLEADQATGHLARLLAEQADAISVLGLPQEALRQYQTALERLDACGLALEASRARLGLGKVLILLQRVAEAEAVLSEAAAGFEQLGHATSRAKVDLLRAELALAQNQRERAESLTHAAMDTLRDRPVDSVAALYMLASLALAADRSDESLQHLNAAMSTADRFGLAPLRSDLLMLRGRVHRRAGDLNSAISDFEAAVEQVERLRGSLQAERFRAAFLGHRSAVFESLIESLLEQGTPAAVRRAFETVEKAKSRALLDHLRMEMDDDEAPAGGHLPDSAEAALLARLSAVRGSLNALYSRLGDDRSQEHTEAEATWRTTVRQYEQELASLESRLAATRGIGGLFAPTLAAKRAMAMLGNGAALIEYFFAGECGLAFIVTNREVHVVRLAATMQQIAAAMQRLQFQINRALRPGLASSPRMLALNEDAQRELGMLYDMVFQPLAPHVRNVERLIFIPHGLLHMLPFHALWSRSAYLIDTHEVQYAPSASLLEQLTQRMTQERTGTSESEKQHLVVGAADEHAPQIEEEAAFISQVLRCPTDRLLLGDRATAQRLHQSARDATLVHLACHGRHVPGAPMASGLKLADGWLTVRDIYAMRLKARLVTLSGCETGMSSVQSGDELMGLARAFLAAGATAILASLWRVDDQTTAEFMSNFYTTIISGTDLAGSEAQALRQAQLAIKSRRPHPAYWAPFVLVGGTAPGCHLAQSLTMSHQP